MILGLGTDITEVPRISSSISRYGDRFIDRIFTQQERTYAEGTANWAERFAARFAAKEAFVKALGTGMRNGMNWTQIEVFHDDLGKPGLRLSEDAEQAAATLGVKTIWLSLTHTKENAFAIVLLEG